MGKVGRNSWEAVVPRLLPRLKQWLGACSFLCAGPLRAPGEKRLGPSLGGSVGFAGRVGARTPFFLQPLLQDLDLLPAREKKDFAQASKHGFPNAWRPPGSASLSLDGSDVFGEPSPKEVVSWGASQTFHPEKENARPARAGQTLSPRSQSQACLPPGSVDVGPVVGLPGGIGSPRTSVIPTSVLLSLSW